MELEKTSRNSNVTLNMILQEMVENFQYQRFFQHSRFLKRFYSLFDFFPQKY